MTHLCTILHGIGASDCGLDCQIWRLVVGGAVLAVLVGGFALWWWRRR